RVEAPSRFRVGLVVGEQGRGARPAHAPRRCADLVKSTAPWGGLLGAVSVSLTVTVQVAGVLAGVEAGQSTLVEVERAVTVIVSLPLLSAGAQAGARRSRAQLVYRPVVAPVKVKVQVELRR